MHILEPKVFLIGEHQVHENGLAEYLEEIGAEDWSPVGLHSDMEQIQMVAGKTCYMSFNEDLNPNLTRVRNDTKSYFENIINVHHGSVLEHGVLTFAIRCSRTCTHEIVRHRQGTSYSQLSMRFVRPKDLGVYLPDAIKGAGEEAVETYCASIKKIEESYQKMVKITGIEDETKFFNKKQMTSSMRAMLPHGIMTWIVMSANFRAIRFMIERRTDFDAEEEIRKVFYQIYQICRNRHRNVFADYEEVKVEGTDIPVVTTKNRKV